MLKKSIILYTLTGLFSLANAANFSPYVDLSLDTHTDATQTIAPIDLPTISTTQGIKSFHLGFINDTGNCTPAWSGMSDITVQASWGKDMIDKLHAKDVQTIISFGGSKGTDLSHACSQDQLTTAYELVIYTYNPQGLDFDIENGTANVAKLITSLQTIQQSHPNLHLSFTLPVMPEGLLAPQQSIITQAKSAGLNFSVNIMTMNYGHDYQNDMGQYAIQAMQNTFSYLQHLYPDKSSVDIWQMIQVTPEIGINEVKHESFTLNNADTVVQFAQQQNIGGVFMWSLNRDKPCSATKATPHCSGAGMQTSQYEFVRHFLGVGA